MELFPPIVTSPGLATGVSARDAWTGGCSPSKEQKAPTDVGAFCSVAGLSEADAASATAVKISGCVPQVGASAGCGQR